MALSDRDRKILEEMDRAFAAEDPKLVAVLRDSHLPRGAKGMTLGIILFLVGMGTVFTGLIAKMIPLGILGFLVALFGVVLIIPTLTAMLHGGVTSSGKISSKGKGKFHTRLEDRWDQRNQGE